MKTDNQCYMFAGPSICQMLQENFIFPVEINLYGPAKRGDIEKLHKQSPPSNIVIVDGLFHQKPAVGHKEIREAIKDGWQIWGLSSIGAIRAFELKDFGMKGYGEVYQWFVNNPNFRDDEVALLHNSDKPYIHISEPLIHIRKCIEYLVDLKIINAEAKYLVINQLKNVWYGNRTLDYVNYLLSQYSNKSDLEYIKKIVVNFDHFRIKTKDVRNFLDEKIWKV